MSAAPAPCVADSEKFEISSESSHTSNDPDAESPQGEGALTAKDREDRQRKKYLQLIAEAEAPATTAWDRAATGEYVCHVSQLAFATAVQCVNHRRKQQYKADLAASGLEEDPEFVAAVERYAQEEKDRLHQQKYAIIKQRNMAKQDLRIEAARLAKANRQLEHELLLAKSRMEKVQSQHERQMEHLKSTYQRRIDKLVRQLDQKAKGPSFPTEEAPSTEPLPWAPPRPAGPPAATTTSWLPSPGGPDPWAPVAFDAFAGLPAPAHKTISPADLFSAKNARPAIPYEVLRAFTAPYAPFAREAPRAPRA